MSQVATEATPVTKKKPREKPHYVNNKEFSQAVADYVSAANRSKESGLPIPVISNYIGECFMKIAEGLSHKPGWARYSYRDEMVWDAVENCVRAIANYDITKTTRTGNPNAFAYFTQITYFAFLRRLAKEKKQQEIKDRLIEGGGIGNFADFEGDEAGIGQSMIERVRQKNDAWKGEDPNPEKKRITVARRAAPPRIHKGATLDGFWVN